MLMSITCAPFSTCWRASPRLVELAVEDHACERLRAGDVVRSPTLMKSVPGVTLNRLEAGEAHHVIGHGGANSG